MNDKPIHPKTYIGRVLIFLAHQDGKWSTWGTSWYMPTVQSVFPVGTSQILQFRFMRRLQSLGLVGGCDCGCRGDYTLTSKGLEFVANECVMGESEATRWKSSNFSLSCY